MIDLTGKVALITGASRGIGRGCAEQVARCGADVASIYRSHGDEADEVADVVRSLGHRASTFGADVSDRAAVDAMVEGATKDLGRVAIVVAHPAVVRRAGARALRVRRCRTRDANAGRSEPCESTISV